MYLERHTPSLRIENDDQNELKFQNVPQGIQICNLGASHGLFGYNYEKYEEEYTCFNFALSSQTLSYDYLVLNHYKEYLAKDAVVFINVSYFQLFGPDETENDGFESKNQRYYQFLYPWEIRGYSIEKEMAAGRLVAFSGDVVGVIKTLLGKEVVLEEEGARSFEERWQIVVGALSDAPDGAVERHLGGGNQNEDGSMCWNRTEMQRLYDIIELCKEIGATPVLVVAPLTSSYNHYVDEMHPGVYDEIGEFLLTVAEKEEIAFYDYSRSDDFQNEYLFFMNFDHLNKSGAAAFTEALMSENRSILPETVGK